MKNLKTRSKRTSLPNVFILASEDIGREFMLATHAVADLDLPDGVSWEKFTRARKRLRKALMAVVAQWEKKEVAP